MSQEKKEEKDEFYPFRKISGGSDGGCKRGVELRVTLLCTGREELSAGDGQHWRDVLPGRGGAFDADQGQAFLTRIGDAWRAEITARFFLNVDSRDEMAGSRDDGFIRIPLARFFSAGALHPIVLAHTPKVHGKAEDG